MRKEEFLAAVKEIEDRKRRGKITLQDAAKEFREVVEVHLNELPKDEAEDFLGRVALADLELERQVRERLGLKVAGRDRTKLQ